MRQGRIYFPTAALVALLCAACCRSPSSSPLESTNGNPLVLIERKATMNEFEFPYFADAQNFAYMTEGVVRCHFCGEERSCLDGGHFYGEGEIEAVCTACMKKGRLKELGIVVNDIDTHELAGTKEEVIAISEEIAYRTPQVPTWQDSTWPVRNGKAYRFIKIASKLDYTSGRSEEEGKSLFVKSLHDNTNDDID